MNCQYYDNNFETCTNGDCPFCSDFCPVTENQEVCRYSELDDTETMLRRCLDAEKEDSKEAIQALAEENRDLKKRLEKVKAERDAAVSDLETVTAYGGGNLDTCQFCKNAQCYARGGAKPCLPQWRGQKEE